MNQTTAKSLQDTNLIVTITVGELRKLVRQEVQAAFGQQMNVATAKTGKSYLSVKDAAALSGLGTSTIRLYIRKGQLAAQRVGRRKLIKQAELITFLDSNPTKFAG